MKLFFPPIIILLFILSGCGNSVHGNSDKSSKHKLIFAPVKDQPVRMNYEFTVNSSSTGNKTHFTIALSGKSGIDEKGNPFLIMQNDHISLDGLVMGKEVKGDAESGDSLSKDLRMVASPVFSLLGKKFKSTYDQMLNKTSEVMITNESSADSSENRMQFFVRFPYEDVQQGSSWDRELIIKSGNKMNCSAHFSLLEINSEKAKISINGKLSGRGQSFGHEFSIDGTMKGIITVDAKTGWPIDTDLTQDFILNLNGQKIPMQYLIRHKVIL